MCKERCEKTGCTLADSGICLLSHSPLSTCPHFQIVPEADAESENQQPLADEVIVEEVTPVIPEKPPARIFHSGLALGSEDALSISRSSYCHLIGILGATDAGKTCYLLSLYLKALRGDLPQGYRLSRSLTFKGFEERARLYRNWQGSQLPERLAERTILHDSRQPSLLHLGLRRGPMGPRVELLLTDLPGEWSSTLVTSASGASRFDFLHRADSILLVVDGEAVMGSSRNIEVTRTKYILNRLKNNVGLDVSIPITVLVTKGDKIGMRQPSAADEIVTCAMELGYTATAVVATAFSYNSAFRSGTGVFEALELALAPVEPAPELPLSTFSPNARRITTFRGRRT